MYTIQCLIVFAVVASNIHWQWTSNTYLAQRSKEFEKQGVALGATLLLTMRILPLTNSVPPSESKSWLISWRYMRLA
jgi:hypothetical protein